MTMLGIGVFLVAAALFAVSSTFEKDPGDQRTIFGISMFVFALCVIAASVTGIKWIVEQF